jgi:hypothetical protein
VSGWLARRREKALNAAYEGALTIQKLERELFGGEKIAYTPEKSKTVCDYAESLRDRQLLKIRWNLSQFKANSFLFDAPVEAETNQYVDASQVQPEVQQEREKILCQLDFIESVVSKYRGEGNLLSFLGSTDEVDDLDQNMTGGAARDMTLDTPTLEADRHRNPNSLFPRFRLPLREMSASYEEQVVGTLRLRKQQNRTAIRWLAVLLIVPLSVQILSKNLLFEPLLGTYRDRNPANIILSKDVQEEFARKYLLAKEKIEVATLLGYYDEMNDRLRQEKLEEAAIEIWRESQEEQLNGLKNLLADFVAFFTFLGLLFVGRRQLPVIRSTLNRTFLNLRDPVKVFLFILITDIFVGFHSAEGWEAILEGIFQHFGIPESKFFINGFIATVPVLIDACIKFWIFSYLTRYSPSASAIYERMNT